MTEAKPVHLNDAGSGRSVVSIAQPRQTCLERDQKQQNGVAVGAPAVLLLTNLASYHQVELLDAVHAAGQVRLQAWYTVKEFSGDGWHRAVACAHPNRVLRAGRWPTGAVRLSPELPILLARERIDLLIVGQYSELNFQYAMIWAALRGVPFVFWSEAPGVRFFELSSPVPEWLRPVVRRLAFLPARLAAAQVWGVGAKGVDAFRQQYGGPVHNMPYFFDHSRFPRRAPRAQPGPVRLLFAGRLSYRKGFDVVCDAIEILSRRPRTQEARGWSLSVCGEGRMMDRAQELSRRFPGQVTLLGRVPLPQMPETYARHDVCLVPSRYDGWAMVVPEALAAGLAVVSTRETGCVQDLGQVGPSVEVVPAGDAPALARAIVRHISSDREVFETISERSREIACRYGLSAGVTRFNHLVSTALQQTRHRRARWPA